MDVEIGEEKDIIKRNDAYIDNITLLFYRKEMGERAVFLRQMIKHRKRNASITPSSRFLAKQMIKDIDRSHIHFVIELGAGTGIFTQHILRHALPDTKIIVIEIEEKYVHLLQEKFGERIIVEHADVKDIDLIRKKYGIDKIDLVVSGLPFLPAQSIHNEILRYISQGTIFRTFTYQPRIFKKIYAGFFLRKIGFTLMNIPPVRVYEVNHPKCLLEPEYSAHTIQH